MNNKRVKNLIVRGMTEIIEEGENMLNSMESEYEDKNPKGLVSKEVIIKWHSEYEKWYKKCLFQLEKIFFNDKMTLPNWFKITPLDLREPIQTYSVIKEFDDKINNLKEMHKLVVSIKEEDFEEFLIYQGPPHKVKIKVDDIINSIH